MGRVLEPDDLVGARPVPGELCIGLHHRADDRRRRGIPGAAAGTGRGLFTPPVETVGKLSGWTRQLLIASCHRGNLLFQRFDGLADRIFNVIRKVGIIEMRFEENPLQNRQSMAAQHK